MPAAHCPQCDAYEQRVMARGPGEALPETVAPCPAFAMSDAFRDWAVAQMRREVGAQVVGAGLDRVAVMKVGPDAAARGAAGARRASPAT